MNTSMVAMSGAIMPEPLAKPEIVTGAPAMSITAPAPLGYVSVVMIARAAPSSPSADRAAASSSSLAVIRSAAKGSPITPVEAIKTLPAGTPSTRPVVCITVSTAARPWRPVKALALPEFTTIASFLPGGCAASAAIRS